MKNFMTSVAYLIAVIVL